MADQEKITVIEQDLRRRHSDQHRFAHRHNSYLITWVVKRYYFRGYGSAETIGKMTGD